MSLLPCIQDSNFVEGSVIQLLPYCRKNCSSTKCKGHYVKLGISAPGFYMCPNGLSSLVCISSKGRRVIYSGIRVKGFYDKRKAHISQSSDNIYNPVLRQEQLLSLAKEDIEINEKLMAISEKEEAVNDVLHETRKFNAQIKSICDIIWDEYHNYAQTPPRDLKNLFKYIQNIHVYSYLAYNRFAHYYISTNPELSFGEPYETVVFKKFDKLRMLLEGYGKKNVRIYLANQNKFCYKVYPNFETLLFIVLENAIKYSPKKNNVNVFFTENGTQLDVSVISVGPYCEKDELIHLTEKGYRAQNAILYDSTGRGRGLPFAKKIADMHDIDLEFESNYVKTMQGIKMGDFCVKFHFDQNKQK